MPLFNETRSLRKLFRAEGLTSNIANSGGLTTFGHYAPNYKVGHWIAVAKAKATHLKFAFVKCCAREEGSSEQGRARLKA